MGRNRGAVNVTTNYEVQVKKPFDARTVVPTYADLLLVDNWYKKGTTSIIAYNGLPVSVVDTSDTSKNGLYILFDPACTTSLKSPDVTKEENWHKLAEDADLADYVDTETLTAVLAPYAKASEVVASSDFNNFKVSSEAAILAASTEIAKKVDIATLDSYYKISDADAKFVSNATFTAGLNNKADKETTYTKSEVNDIQADLLTKVNAKADAATTYTKTEINDLIAALEGGSSESADSVARDLAAYISENDAAVLSLENRVGTAKAGEVPATGLFARLENTQTQVDNIADDVAKLLTDTDSNSAKLNGISTTVIQAIEDAINAIPDLEVATSEQLGGIKSGSGDNTVSVDNDGIASVKTINVNTLSQSEGDTLILSGGSSDSII
jgi:hypothetical protein